MNKYLVVFDDSLAAPFTLPEELDNRGNEWLCKIFLKPNIQKSINDEPEKECHLATSQKRRINTHVGDLPLWLR